MEEATTEYILSSEDEKIYNNIKNAMKKSLTIQRFLYFTNKIPKHYDAKVIINKPDKISVVDKTFRLRIGNYGIFVKQNDNISGVTYLKTGRSSARIKYWGSRVNASLKNELLLDLVNRVNPSCYEIITDKVIASIGTKGMGGSIIAGKITSIEEAMIYYIRYSLRGLGINLTKNIKLYNFYKVMGDYHMANLVLRTCSDVNSFLDIFVTPNRDELGINVIDIKRKALNHGMELTNCCLITGEKIDWGNSEMDPIGELEKLSKKVNWIKDVSELWDGGPVLSTGSPHPVIRF